MMPTPVDSTSDDEIMECTKEGCTRCLEPQMSSSQFCSLIVPSAEPRRSLVGKRRPVAKLESKAAVAAEKKSETETSADTEKTAASVDNDSSDSAATSSSSSTSESKTSSSSDTEEQQEQEEIQKEDTDMPILVTRTPETTEIPAAPLKSKQVCQDPRCKDANCKLPKKPLKTCTDPNCTDKNCAWPAGKAPVSDAAAAGVCTDANCTDANCKHKDNSDVRNAFFGIAGVLILAIIGYMAFIKMKTKRMRPSKAVAV